jgi:hypothetical protein
MALLNIYFGEDAVLGRWREGRQVFTLSEYERDVKRTLSEIMVDMAGWFGEKDPV